MKATKILTEEIKDIKVASLPSRPTAPAAFGGRGYTAREMKEAFDKLPLFIIERFNALIDDIANGEIAGEILTGIRDGHTLAALFSDITSGDLASYLDVGGKSLMMTLAELRSEINALKGEGAAENV